MIRSVTFDKTIKTILLIRFLDCELDGVVVETVVVGVDRVVVGVLEMVVGVVLTIVEDTVDCVLVSSQALHDLLQVSLNLSPIEPARLQN